VTLPAVLFASGGGSNVRALLDAHREASGGRPGDSNSPSPSAAPSSPPASPPSWFPALLVTDRADAPVLEHARAYGLPYVVVPPGPDFESRLVRVLTDAAGGRGAGILVLAGYLRLVPPGVVRRWAGRILNVHPSLLPAFGGKGMYGARIHAAVLDAGVQVTGVTVHLVDERFDEGPILAQWPVPVLPDDTPASLAARVLTTEHRLYPAVVEHVATWLVDRDASASADAHAPPPSLSASQLLRNGLVFP